MICLRTVYGSLSLRTLTFGMKGVLDWNHGSLEDIYCSILNSVGPCVLVDFCKGWRLYNIGSPIW